MPTSCPFLSTPAKIVSGKAKDAVHAPCIGHQCSLYRQHDQVCAIIEIPDIVDRVAAMDPVIREMLEDHLRALDRVGHDNKEILTGWTGENRAVVGRLEKATDKVLADTTEQLAGLHSMLVKVDEVNSRLQHVEGTLQRSLDRVEDEERHKKALEASREAIDLYRKGDFSTAMSVLVNAQGILGEMPDLLCTLGCVYLAVGRCDRAIEALKKSVQLDPECAEAHVNLGAAYLMDKKTDEAEASLREGLRLNPESGAGWNTLGNLLFSAGKRIKGVAAWRRAVAHSPDLEAAWENLRRQQSADNVPFELLRTEALGRHLQEKTAHDQEEETGQQAGTPDGESAQE